MGAITSAPLAVQAERGSLSGQGPESVREPRLFQQSTDAPAELLDTSLCSPIGSMQSWNTVAPWDEQ
eukprot:1426342-Alexandrium_andersonii.AAC.1